MRGSVRKRGERWCYIVDIGRDEEDKRKQKWISGFRTRKEAESALTAALNTLEHGGDPFPEKMTLTEYLTSWLSRKEHEVRHGTFKRYEQLVRDHIKPPIGNVQLDRIKPAHVQAMLDAMRNAGLSPRTIAQARSTLGTALQQALLFGLIYANPVRAIQRPRIERPNLTIPSVEELTALMEAARSTPWSTPMLLSASTGARRGEVLAVRWSDVDIERARLRIVRAIHRTPKGLEFLDPKTDRARRELALPAFTVASLRRHRAEQAARRLQLGEAWIDGDLICERGDGGPLDPDGYSKAFKRLAKTAGLPKAVRLHDMRHAVATALLEQGIHPTITSAVLGHSNPAFTMSTYQHVRNSMTDKAAQALDVAFGP